MTATVPVSTPDGEMSARLLLPAGGSGPGVLLLQEIFGVSDYVMRRAQDLADLGYVVLVPEVFWRLGTTTVQNGPDMLDEAMGLVGRLDWEAAVSDSVAAFGVLRARAEVTASAGLVGFCFGGGLAFAVAAATEPDAVVCYYGSGLPDLLDLSPKVTAPQLHHFGEQDGYIDAAAVARVEERVREGGEVEFHRYPGADHAFDNDDLWLHHPQASAEAWRTTVDFLARRLPVG